jgi:thiamine-monophosphate kinase
MFLELKALARKRNRNKLKNESVLGERRIIEVVRSRLDLMPQMAAPFGDDVSAYPLGNHRIAVLKTDMLVAKTDVPATMTLWQVGRKAVVMNVSDFAAKGVKPAALLVSLGLPRGMSEENVEELADGLNTGARENGAYILGGDTGEASDLVVSISLFGTTPEGGLMLRCGAQPGDYLATTGFFGKTSAGLQILLNDIKVPESRKKPLIESVLLPLARLKEGLALRRSGCVTAAIDSSDGLAWSLHEIAKASNVGMIVDKLPAAPEASDFAAQEGMDLTELVLYGGEEYELLVTVKPSMWMTGQKAVKRVGGQLLKIGRVTAEKTVILKTNHRKSNIEQKGYEHFK